jgi:hypothetical protein
MSRLESIPRLHGTLPLITLADLCEQEGRVVLQKTGPIMSRRPESIFSLGMGLSL